MKSAVLLVLGLSLVTATFILKDPHQVFIQQYSLSKLYGGKWLFIEEPFLAFSKQAIISAVFILYFKVTNSILDAVVVIEKVFTVYWVEFAGFLTMYSIAYFVLIGKVSVAKEVAIFIPILTITLQSFLLIRASDLIIRPARTVIRRFIEILFIIGVGEAFHFYTIRAIDGIVSNLGFRSLVQVYFFP